MQLRSMLRISRQSYVISSISVKFISTSHATHSRRLPDVCRIGCSSGFWGDTSVSSRQLVQSGNIDYLVSDYLSEITMSLLAGAKKKSPKLGFAPDFINFGIGPILGEIVEKDIRVVTNAGGINPLSCAEYLIGYGRNIGLDLSSSVAVVTGDDVMGKLPNASSKLVNANVYLGAQPIAKALDSGAKFVITGRCVDSALVLGPLMHEFRWSAQDLNKLAMGSLAGHIIECGAQCTGGIFTDYETVPDWHEIGFPIAECHSNGDLFITKPEGTGGLVNTATVGEQVVYEIGDPAAYLLPDCTVDLRGVQLKQAGTDRVGVSGALGNAPPKQLKLSACESDGYRLTAVSVVAGGRATRKARMTADAVLKRVRQIFTHLGHNDFTSVNVQVIGAEDAFGDMRITNNSFSREAVLWLAASHESKEALEILSREMAPAGTGMAPGLTALVGGRPKVSPVLRLSTQLVPRSMVQPEVTFVGGRRIQVDDCWDEQQQQEEETKEETATMTTERVPSERREEQEKEKQRQQRRIRREQAASAAAAAAAAAVKLPCQLIDLAFARSGDKGDSCNIGVIARRPEYYPILIEKLTSAAVASYFEHVFPEDVSPHQMVQRYELPGLHALNFVLESSLGGGGVASLRYDPQGKAFAQMLLDMRLH